MNNRQRDAAAAALRVVAAELDGARAAAETKAAGHADASGANLTCDNRRTFIESFVDAWCADQLVRGAASIRAIVEVYLTTPAPGRKRGRR